MASKPRNACAKRFKVTGSGKLMRRRGRSAHLLTKKTSKQKRAAGSAEVVAGADARAIRRMLER